MNNELAFIEWIRSRSPSTPRVSIGIGDDTAALRGADGRELLCTTDMVLEGIHFELGSATLREVGRKALAVNLSDIAAMAGVPVAALVAVALPERTSEHDAQELYHGIRQLADQFGVAIVGGDTNRSPGGLVICVTLIGETTARGPVRRSGARVGDWILVTGSLGGSLLGKHLTFTPRVREALVLHERYDLHSMIDLSDGLAADLGHILDESACGAVLRAGAIPISAAARQAPADQTPLDRALHDGEDFELLFTLAEESARRLLAEQPLEVAVSHVGSITALPQLMLQAPDGSSHPLEPKGYDHFRR